MGWPLEMKNSTYFRTFAKKRKVLFLDIDIIGALITLFFDNVF